MGSELRVEDGAEEVEDNEDSSESILLEISSILVSSSLVICTLLLVSWPFKVGVGVNSELMPDTIAWKMEGVGVADEVAKPKTLGFTRRGCKEEGAVMAAAKDRNKTKVKIAE